MVTKATKRRNTYVKPPCEVCGKHKCTYEELLFLDEDDLNNGEFAGMHACPDCVFEIHTMHRNPITKEPMVAFEEP